MFSSPVPEAASPGEAVCEDENISLKRDGVMKVGSGDNPMKRRLHG
jgi:hypothetical protein